MGKIFFCCKYCNNNIVIGKMEKLENYKLYSVFNSIKTFFCYVRARLNNKFYKYDFIVYFDIESRFVFIYHFYSNGKEDRTLSLGRAKTNVAKNFCEHLSFLFFLKL